MKILIKTVQGKSINFEVEDSSETIDLKILGESTRKLVLRLGPIPDQDAVMRIFVSTLKGKTFNLVLKGSETIEQVKAMIHDQGGPPVDQQTLLFHGLNLDDSRTIADYNIKTESNLVIMSRLCGC